MSLEFSKHLQSDGQHDGAVGSVTMFDAHAGGTSPGTSSTESADDSKRLETAGTIPRLELTGSTQTAHPAAHKDWTIAVQFGASVAGDKEQPQGWGVDRQLKELQKLAAETEGKSVSFVVHAERPVDPRGKLCDQADAEKASTCTTRAVGAGRAVTERYFIHDGKIEKLPDAKYKDAAEDIKALLHDTSRLAPSDKLGLMLQSHGMGSEGIATNLGPVSLDKTISAVEAGLKETGHKKLDILDYNSCDMGAATVLDKSRRVADDVLASAAVEGTTDTSDAQNMGAAMRLLLANSKMTGRDLGEAMVEQARAGVNGTEQNNATITLANFDLTKYDAFKKDLDRFGDALSTAAGTGDNLKQIQEDVDRTIVPVSGMPETLDHNRDLKTFAEKILSDIEAHKISGDTKQLEEATRSLLLSFNNLTSARYGDRLSGYQDLGGLTVSLPGREILDQKEVARALSPVHYISTQLKQMLDHSPQLSDKIAMFKDLDPVLQRLGQDWHKLHPGELKALKDAREQVDKAQDVAAFRAAAGHLQALAKSYDIGPIGSETTKRRTEAAHAYQANFLRAPQEHLAPAWDQFVTMLRAKAR